MNESERIAALRNTARVTGLTIDFLDHLTLGLDGAAFAKVIANAERAAMLAWLDTLSPDESGALRYCLEKGAASKERGAMARALNQFRAFYQAQRAPDQPAPPA